MEVTELFYATLGSSEAAQQGGASPFLPAISYYTKKSLHVKAYTSYILIAVENITQFLLNIM